MKIKNPCAKAEDDNEHLGKVALIEDADYEIEEDYKVANYNPEHVKNEYLDIFHTTMQTFSFLLSGGKHQKSIC